MSAATAHAAEATARYGSLPFLPTSNASLITVSKSSPGQNLPTHANAWQANHGSLISRARVSAVEGSLRANEAARSLACVGLSLIGCDSRYSPKSGSPSHYGKGLGVRFFYHHNTVGYSRQLKTR